MATQTLTLATGADDGHWGFGTINYFGTTNAPIGNFSGYQFHWWSRWQITADVAQGSTINSGTFSGRKISSGSGTGWSATAKFVDQANPSNPSDASAADALLAAAASGSGNSFTNTDFPDDDNTFSLIVANALQELLNARALVTGNYIMLILQSTAASAFRRISPYENSPSPVPTLAFDWTEPPTGNRRRRLLLAA